MDVKKKNGHIFAIVDIQIVNFIKTVHDNNIDTIAQP